MKFPSESESALRSEMEGRLKELLAVQELIRAAKDVGLHFATKANPVEDSLALNLRVAVDNCEQRFRRWLK